MYSSFLARTGLGTQRACRKSEFFKKRSLCWMKNEKLISAIESVSDL
jgi:hypothetical protein